MPPSTGQPSTPSGKNLLRVPNMNMDGPGDTGSVRSSASRASHQSGNPPESPGSGTAQRSRSASQSSSKKAPSEPGSPGKTKPAAATEVPTTKPEEDRKRFATRYELPPDAYYETGRIKHPFATRPSFTTTGQEVKVQVNQFRVTSTTGRDIYQYDVSISPIPKMASKVIYKKVWDSPEVQKILKSAGGTQYDWIYDGKFLAWSPLQLKKEQRVNLDLGAASGRPGRPQNQFYFIMKPAGKFNMEFLNKYLQGSLEWDEKVLVNMTFLDHLMREGPMRSMKLLRRNFFHANGKTLDLSPFSSAIKGTYASMRISQTIKQGGTGLGVNVDVANMTFWQHGEFLHTLIRSYICNVDRKWARLDWPELAKELRPVQVKRKNRDGAEVPCWEYSEAFQALRRLTRSIKFKVKQRGKVIDEKVYTLMGFASKLEFAPDSTHCKNLKFEWKKEDDTVKTVTIFDYFQEKYKCNIEYWRLPLVKTSLTRDTVYPPEICMVEPWCPYPFKLSPSETQEMIKFAVERPRERMDAIMHNVKNLQWAQDPYLLRFGMQISPVMPMVKARVLKNPEVQFGTGKINPRTSGRWDLRGQKFVSPNAVPLKSWAFCVLDASVDKPTLENFIRQFMNTYKGHGGRVEAPPQVYGFPANGVKHDDYCDNAYMSTGRATRATPQIIFWVLKDKTAWIYTRMKKILDCKYACLSQMLQRAHVVKAQAQYCSNVSMKVNSKLGGQTSRIPYPKGMSSPWFKVPTMIIGADVSHGSPGSKAPSIAAICCSMDRDGAIYRAGVQTNGTRDEMIEEANWFSIMPDMIEQFRKRNNGMMPQNVFYFRDGVSEGEYNNVVGKELADIRACFVKINSKISAKASPPKFTVIVCTKRHHIRFFPDKQSGDKNGNPLPGTLVETEVTHPFHYDFFMCSHVAIQGTARPMKYNVLHDEIAWKPEELQYMIYHMCYQYCRSTTPVSLPPPVYYAHLAADRARAHENIATSYVVPEQVKVALGPKQGAMAKHDKRTADDIRSGQEKPLPLVPLGGDRARDDAREIFRNTMWWV